MSDSSEWSPDEPPDTEAFEQGDEAFTIRPTHPCFLEGVELDPRSTLR